MTESNHESDDSGQSPADSEDETVGEGGPHEEQAVAKDLELVQKALEETEAELANHREGMLRMQAEMENLRKRLVRDLDRSRKFALENIMKDLLQVRDSLERGLEMADDSTTVQQLREGKELTLKMLTKVMAEHGLEVIDPKGEAFDPEWHEAVATLPSDEGNDNVVMEVLQKGFKLHDRLVRPAMVVVAQKQ